MLDRDTYLKDDEEIPHKHNQPRNEQRLRVCIEQDFVDGRAKGSNNNNNI